MKKFALFLVCLFLCICSTGLKAQNLAKGSILGLHDVPITLSPGITMDQYVKFVNEKFIPAYEKNYPGVKCYMFKAKRGSCADCYGFAIFFPTDQERNKYWNSDNSLTEAGQKASDAMKPIVDEMNKLGSFNDRFTDWEVL